LAFPLYSFANWRLIYGSQPLTPSCQKEAVFNGMSAHLNSVSK
jgi:hypothetical protein